MRKLRRRFRTWREKRRRRKRRLSKRKQRVQQLRERLELVEQRLKEHRAKLNEERSEEEQEAYADRLDELQARRRRVRDELEVMERRFGRARHRWRFARRRVTHLRNRINLRRDYASVHFRYDEFNCREGGPVPEYMYPHLRDYCQRVLEPMRARFGAAYVNSGHRWDFYNAKIGGASQSFHVYENRREQPAGDCTFATGRPADWAHYARELAEGGVGSYSTFVHTDTGPRRDWWG